MTSVRIQQAPLRTALILLAVATSVAFVVPGTAVGQVRQYALEAISGLRLNNVAAEPAVLDGKKGMKVTWSEETLRRLPNMTPEEQLRLEPLALIEGLDFANGVIEAEIAGMPAPGANEGARGFVGIAFRLQNDMRTYDAFYLRPTNGRVEDQERRNHAAQYIAHPDWPWFRTRKETPSKYRIVRGPRAGSLDENQD